MTQAHFDPATVQVSHLTEPQFNYPTFVYLPGVGRTVQFKQHRGYPNSSRMLWHLLREQRIIPAGIEW